MTLMESIKQFQRENIFGQALIMVRGKITGRAAQILINNNTKHNFEAIIDRLDDSYADQRPLYVLEEEMMKVRQENLPLHVYYDRLNQSLNLVLSKIEMSHKNEYVATALSKEVQWKGVRTFITGLRSMTTKNALYSRNCTSLTEAYGIARTMQHDSQYHQLEYTPRMMSAQKNHNGNFQRYQYQPRAPEPMEVDPSSAQFRRPTQHPKPPYVNQQQPPRLAFQNPSRNTFNNIGSRLNQYIPQKRNLEESFQQLTKRERVNQLSEEQQEVQSLYNEPASDADEEQHHFL